MKGGRRLARKPEGKPGHRPAPKSKQARKAQEERQWLRKTRKAKASESL
jgi:hypothetical protein